MPNPEIESLLRERIDDLSTRLLIEEPGPEALGGGPGTFLAVLAELGRQAGDAGYGEAARVAQELSEGQPLVAQLQEGLARLQQALSDGASDAAPAPPVPERLQATFSLAQDPELVADFILESREHLSMGFVNFRYTLPGAAPMLGKLEK